MTKHNFTFIDNTTAHSHNTRSRNYLDLFDTHRRRRNPINSVHRVHLHFWLMSTINWMLKLCNCGLVTLLNLCLSSGLWLRMITEGKGIGIRLLRYRYGLKLNLSKTEVCYWERLQKYKWNAQVNVILSTVEVMN